MNVRIIVVGLGRIGKRHATIIDQMNNTSLVATVDTNPSADRSGLSEVPHFTDLESVFESDLEFDLVSIATPNGLHCPQAKACLEAGYHVLVEKPLGINSSETQQVLDAAQTHNRKLFVVKQNRYSPPIKWLKQIVDNQVLGSLYLVQINCFWNRDERYYKSPEDWHGSLKLDGGVLYTQFSHFIDIMHWVFGDVEDVQTKMDNFNHAHNTEFEDSGITHFRFKNGGMGVISFTTSVWDKNMESSITVIGENGSLKIGGQYMNEIEHCHIKNYEMPELEDTNPPNDYGPYKGSAANHQYVFDNIVDVLNHNSAISPNGHEGAKVVEIIEKIHQGNS